MRNVADLRPQFLLAFTSLFKYYDDFANTPLIPRQVILGNPDYTGVQLSPDGNWLSYLKPLNGVLNVWVRNLSNASWTKDVPVTSDTGRGIEGYSWVFDNQHIVYGNDKDGDENFRIFKVNVATNETTKIIETDGVRAAILSMSRLKPTQMIVAMNDRDPRYHDLYHLNVVSGNLTLLLLNTIEFSVDGFVFDENLVLRLGAKSRADGGKDYYKRNITDGSWSLYRQLSRDEIATSPVGFDATLKYLYWLDNTKRDKLALIKSNFEEPHRSPELIFEPKRADISGALFHPLEKIPLAVAETYLRAEWKFLNDSIKDEFEYINRTLASNNRITIAGTSLDFNKWLIIQGSDSAPGKYFLFDRQTRNIEFLFASKEDLKDYKFTKMQALEVATRDGLVQTCYLTMPIGADPLLKGRPLRPLPMVLSVHGGPQARDNYGFNAMAQFISNRGYAFLSCNFRGSTGFGKSFVNAGNGEWGAKMQDDLSDAVEWAINERIAIREKVAIMGASYGGYATLMGLATTPEQFACGVDIVGPSSLLTLLESIPPYWESVRNQLLYRLGADPSTPEGKKFLKERSPLYLAHKIKRKLLIGQGANDPRVHRRESEQIVEALMNHSIPVTYALFPDEGHGFVRPANTIGFFAVVESFLKDCLGGRAEPYKNDVENSSMQLIAHDG